MSTQNPMITMTHPQRGTCEQPWSAFRDHWVNEGWTLDGEPPVIEDDSAEAFGEYPAPPASEETPEVVPTPAPQQVQVTAAAPAAEATPYPTATAQ